MIASVACFSRDDDNVCSRPIDLAVSHPWVKKKSPNGHSLANTDSAVDCWMAVGESLKLERGMKPNKALAFFLIASIKIIALRVYQWVLLLDSKNSMESCHHQTRCLLVWVLDFVKWLKDADRIVSFSEIWKMELNYLKLKSFLHYARTQNRLQMYIFQLYLT